MSASALPAPEANALDASAALAERIGAAIDAARGFLRFDDYMRLALYAPGLGYYAGGAHRFGHFARDGSDFVTAPELSELFAPTLATQVAQVLDASNASAVMEFGAGTGALAAGLLDALGAACTRYSIVEVSGALRARQQATLAERAPAHAHKVEWLGRLPERFDGCVLGNEVLDAMPIRIARKTALGYEELGVARGASRTHDTPFVWTARAADDALRASIARKLPDGVDALDEGYLVELHDEAEAFAATIARMLNRGAALFIDYGFPAHEYYHPQRARGTLICHYRHHAVDDPLRWPGLQDITAHVDFSGVAQAALDAGAQLAGYTSQARFLMNCGLLDRLGARAEPGSADYLRATHAAMRLISEAEMGELFKAIAFTRGIDNALTGFARGDRSAAL